MGRAGYVNLSDLYQLAEATQRLYLNHPPFYEDYGARLIAERQRMSRLINMRGTPKEDGRRAPFRRRSASPRFNPGTQILRFCALRLEIEEAALLPIAPTLRSGKLDRPVKYRFFRRSNFWPYGRAASVTGPALLPEGGPFCAL